MLSFVKNVLARHPRYDQVKASYDYDGNFSLKAEEPGREVFYEDRHAIEVTSSSLLLEGIGRIFGKHGWGRPVPETIHGQFLEVKEYSKNGKPCCQDEASGWKETRIFYSKEGDVADIDFRQSGECGFGGYHIFANYGQPDESTTVGEKQAKELLRHYKQVLKHETRRLNASHHRDVALKMLKGECQRPAA